MAPLTLLLLCQVALYTIVTSKKACGRPPLSDGIDVSSLKSVYDVGEEVTLACEQGYTPSTPSPHKLACTPTQEWTATDLACTRRTCPIPRPLQDLVPGRTQVPFKTVLNYTCDEGYVMTGANESTCLADGTWSHPPPLCKAVSCALPKPPRDGRFVLDKAHTATSTMYGQGWTYECTPPKAPSFERGECLADGTATEPPVCRDISCPIPEGIPNGFLAFAVMRTHGYKGTVRYACNDHYVLDGQAENRCTNTGNWSTKPVCRGCPRPVLTPHVEALGLQLLSPPGTEAHLTCAPGYTTQSGVGVIICSVRGTWGRTEFVCQPKMCPAIDTPPNAEMHFEDNLYQSRVNFTCNEGYNLHGASSVVCQENAEWSASSPECKVVTCGPPPIPDNARIVKPKSRMYLLWNLDSSTHVSNGNLPQSRTHRSWSHVLPHHEQLQGHHQIWLHGRLHPFW
uniref:Beta-2-glycoprotein 1-like n=1 Tax=Gadus morhua TaxID=8049 RepID=A0A8C5BXU1_GADMO